MLKLPHQMDIGLNCNTLSSCSREQCHTNLEVMLAKAWYYNFVLDLDTKVCLFDLHCIILVLRKMDILKVEFLLSR